MVGEVSGSRLESIFSRIGLVVTAVLALLALLVLDVALTAKFSPGVASDNEAFSMHLVTSDGRDLGGQPGANAVALKPLTLYENVPNPDSQKYRINEFGLRGGETEREPTRPRVVVIGGSAAFGLRVPERDTFAVELESRLNGVEVLNAGVPGYLSTQELALVATRLLDLGPDVFVVFDGWNDVYDPYWWSLFGDGERAHPGVNNSFLTLEDRLARYQEIQKEPLTALHEAGRAFVRISSTLGWVARWLHTEPGVDSGAGLTDAQLSDIARAYVTNIRTLQHLANARGAELLVVVQPELGQHMAPERLSRLEGRPAADFISGDAYAIRFPEIYANFRDRVIPALQSSGVRVIDASARLSSLPSPDNLFTDAVHLNAQGHERVAEILEEPVSRLLGRASHGEVPAAQP